MKIDLSADLGEGEPVSRTRALLRRLSSANIACGGHAGDLTSMRKCVEMAAALGVRIGAHPGAPSRLAFGRGELRIEPSELAVLLVQQVGGMQAVVRACGAELHHVKLHGSLYHLAESDPAHARAYLATVREYFPGLVVYGLSGGNVAKGAKRFEVPFWEEGFIDRGYLSNGQLVDRSRPGALLDAERAIEQGRMLIEQGRVKAVDGARIPVSVRTLCVHSDSLDATKIVAAIRRMLDAVSG